MWTTTPTQSIQQQKRSEQVQMLPNLNTEEKTVKTLCQVMNTPINCVSFMRNFETCLEDDAENSRNL